MKIGKIKINILLECELFNQIEIHRSQSEKLIYINYIILFFILNNFYYYKTGDKIKYKF